MFWYNNYWGWQLGGSVEEKVQRPTSSTTASSLLTTTTTTTFVGRQSRLCNATPFGRTCFLLFFLVVCYPTNSSTFFVESSSSTSTTSSSTTSNNLYESIRILDNSGQSIQLKHAQAAADEQGRFLIVLQRSTNECWIGTIRRRQSSLSYLRQDKDDNDNNGSTISTNYELVTPITYQNTIQTKQQWGLKTRRMQQPQQQRFPAVLAVCTGYQADAIWLVRQLQLYTRTVQERYNNNIPYEIAHIASIMIMKSFWGYSSDEDDTVISEPWIGRATTVLDMMKTNDNGGVWSRPIGVRTILISIIPKHCRSKQQSASSSFVIQLIEPSGIVQTIDTITCIGKYSRTLQPIIENEIQLVLSKQNNTGLIGTTEKLSDSQIEEILITAISKGLGLDTTATTSTTYTPSNDFELYIESISIETNTITSRTIQFT